MSEDIKAKNLLYKDYLEQYCNTEVSEQEASNALMIQTELLRVLDQTDREQKQTRKNKKRASLKKHKGADND